MEDAPLAALTHRAGEVAGLLQAPEHLGDSYRTTWNVSGKLTQTDVARSPFRAALKR